MNRRFMSASMLMDFTASKLASMVAGVLMVGAVLDAAVAHSALTVPIWPPLNTTVPNLRALALSGEPPRRIRSTRAVGICYTALEERSNQPRHSSGKLSSRRAGVATLWLPRNVPR